MSETKQTEAQATETAKTAIPETTTQPEANNVELTVNDLGNLKQIIDVASQRGAFKPSEMTVVGTTYSKLEQFLAAVAAQNGDKNGN